MKSYLLLLAFFLSIAACNQGSKQEKQTTGSKPVSIKISELASNKDYSCGMDLAEGSVADTASYEGKTYGFCSTECKADFLKNPQAHLTQK